MNWFKNLFSSKKKKTLTDEELRYREAVRNCLVMSHKRGGVIIVNLVEKRIEHYPRLGAQLICEKDLIEGCDWWEIDMSRGIDNYRRLSPTEIISYVKMIKDGMNEGIYE